MSVGSSGKSCLATLRNSSRELERDLITLHEEGSASSGSAPTRVVLWRTELRANASTMQTSTSGCATEPATRREMTSFQWSTLVLNGGDWINLAGNGSAESSCGDGGDDDKANENTSSNKWRAVVRQRETRGSPPADWQAAIDSPCWRLASQEDKAKLAIRAIGWPQLENSRRLCWLHH